MKILFTGGSSFTGFWFIRELARAGHGIVATFRRKADEYPDAVRQQRVKLAGESCRAVFGASFGDDAFLKLIRESGPFDLLCHHAADVTNYKSPDFDVPAALANNTRNLGATLTALRERGAKAIVLTGSVFENDEGAGSEGLPAFSPYGLSKALTYQLFRYHAPRSQLRLGKFVIPNPFGPYEEPRFTSYLAKNWFAGATPAVGTPSYVRDNIHVSLLAKVYAKFAGDVAASTTPFAKINPSGYAESQGAFTQRFAAEMKQRLGLPCAFELKRQTDFSEPRVRINTEWADAIALGWDESAAWDELAEYYKKQFAAKSE